METNTTVIIGEVEGIELSHVLSCNVNVDRLLLEDYPGAERDLALLLVTKFYQLNFASKFKPTDGVALRERALSYSKWYTIRRLNELTGLVERATLYSMDEANQTGWFHDMEYDSLEDMLSSIYEEHEGQSEAYDWKFIVEQLVPAAKEAGIPSGTLMMASLSVKKLRMVVPAARELFKKAEEGIVTEEESKETLFHWLEQIASRDVTASTFREETDKWRNRSSESTKPLHGYQFMMPDGDWWVVSIAPDNAKLATVQQALRNRVEIQTTDLGFLLKTINEMLKETNKIDV